MKIFYKHRYICITNKGRILVKKNTGANQGVPQTKREYNPEDKNWVHPDIDTLIDKLMKELVIKFKRTRKKITNNFDNNNQLLFHLNA